MKIMTIYAHPADTITNCGGTLARQRLSRCSSCDQVKAFPLSHLYVISNHLSMILLFYGTLWYIA